MKDTRLLPDDPKLTAYALGELAGDKRAAVEAALRQNPALRVIVDDIRATAAQIEGALAEEAASAPIARETATTGSAIELNGHAAATPPPRNRRHAPPLQGNSAGRYPFPRTESKLIRFPYFYYVIGGAAAACFAVLVALRDKPPAVQAPVSERTVVREIALSSDVSHPASTLPAEAGVARPVEAAVADAGVPPAQESAPPPVAPPADRALPAANTAVASASFIEGNLSLVAQTRRDADRPFEDTALNKGTPANASVQLEQRGELTHAQAVAGGETFTAMATVSSVSGTLTSPSAVPVTSVNEKPAPSATGSARVAPAAPIIFNAPPPAFAGPAIAGSNIGSLVPGSTGLLSTTPVTAAPGSGEVVMLSAFMVASDRAHGFAMSTTAQRLAAGKRGSVDRDPLPHPPPGAKFGRNTESYSYVRDNDFVRAADHPLSTFSIDVDTASYANVRRIIGHGSPPPRDAVRIEELLNYFPYRYAPPRDDAPFGASLEVADAPWAPKHKLVRIGLKAREVTTAQRPVANLVFLLDVSSSMNQPNKLPLVKQSLKLLIGNLRPDDRVAIVTYAGNSGLALAPTPVAQAREILNALDALTPVGPASASTGIQLAYDVAVASFVKDGVNRVILCTDGDFDVGIASEGDLVRLIERNADSGVFLTVLGFGMGNYKDAMLEKLANKGNGVYGYIDTLREAEKLLVEQVSGTLVTIAKDVKIMVDFNPARVASYRLIGYENRLLRREDFSNDKVDAGEIGAGHTVTALYEIVPVGAEDKTTADVSPAYTSKYATRGAVSSRLEMPDGKRESPSNELLTVIVRYKKPDSIISWPRTLDFALIDAATPFAKASSDFRFAAAVAQFGMILRGSPHRGTAAMGDVIAWAVKAAATPADDPGGYRGEFIDLMRKTQSMME